MTLAPLLRIKSKVLTEHARGRDALFRKERLRKEYWRTLKDRSELRHLREQMAIAQRQSEQKNELERVEGALAHHSHHFRLAHLSRARTRLRAELGLPD